MSLNKKRLPWNYVFSPLSDLTLILISAASCLTFFNLWSSLSPIRGLGANCPWGTQAGALFKCPWDLRLFALFRALERKVDNFVKVWGLRRVQEFLCFQTILSFHLESIAQGPEVVCCVSIKLSWKLSSFLLKIRLFKVQILTGWFYSILKWLFEYELYLPKHIMIL